MNFCVISPSSTIVNTLSILFFLSPPFPHCNPPELPWSKSKTLQHFIPQFSDCSCWASNSGITKECVQNADSQAPHSALLRSSGKGEIGQQAFQVILMNSHAWEPQIYEGSQEIYYISSKNQKQILTHPPHAHTEAKNCWKLCIYPSLGLITQSYVSFSCLCRVILTVGWLWDLLLIRNSDW